MTWNTQTYLQQKEWRMFEVAYEPSVPGVESCVPYKIYAAVREGFLARVAPVRWAWMELKRRSSSGLTDTFWLNPMVRAARRMKETRLEYIDSWMEAARDWVRVIGTPSAVSCMTNLV